LSYRDLTKIDRALKNVSRLATFGLRQHFSKKPAYWFDLYQLRVNRIYVYMWSTQYSFDKADANFADTYERVTGHNVRKKRYTQIHSIVEDLFSCIEEKIKGGWVLEEFSIDQALTDRRTIHLIDTKWKETQGRTTPSAPPTIKKETKKSAFQKAEIARKNKARW
jgi:hypothetical protein